MVGIVFIKPFVCLHDDLSHNGKGFPNNTKIVLSFSVEQSILKDISI